MSKTQKATPLEPTIVKTDQSLVHVRHSITIRQYKFWHLILKSFGEQIKQGALPDSNGFYYHSISQISEFLGYDVARSELRNDFEALRIEPIIVNYLEKNGQPAAHYMGFVSEYKILAKRVGFRLPSIVENIIRNEEQNQQMFLLLNWNIFNSFSGKYEAILYKLCRDYIGVGRTPKFTIEKYREYMGIAENEYKEFKELNRWVIKKPLAELKKSPICDIAIEVEFERTGRYVTGLQFKVTPVGNALPMPEVLPEVDCTAFKGALVEIPDTDKKKYLEKFSQEEIAASITRANIYIEDLKAKGSVIKHNSIYHKAITENWGLAQLEEEKLKKAAEEAAAEKARQAEEQKRLQEEEKQRLLDLDEKFLSNFLEMPDNLKEDLIMGMIGGFSKMKQMYDMMNELYKEHGFDAHNQSRMFRGNLISAIKSDLGFGPKDNQPK